jgi:hypothetical protein
MPGDGGGAGRHAGLAADPAARGRDYVGSSFQFLLPGWDAAAIAALVARAAARGVELKWFGAAEPVAFTSRYDSWRYAPAAVLPQTDRVLAGLIDMRLPLTFMPDDVALDRADHPWHPSRHLWRTEPWRSLVRRGQWAVWHGCCGG